MDKDRNPFDELSEWLPIYIGILKTGACSTPLELRYFRPID